MDGYFSSPRKNIVIDMSGSVAQFVIHTIAQNKVVIFSKSNCPYCKIAKQQFRMLNCDNVLTVEINQRNDGNEIQAIMGHLTGGSSVPRVFVDGMFIGGGTHVKKLYENGNLKEMLA